MTKIKRYDELPAEEWNVRCFQDFLRDSHEDILGVTYQPARGYAAEAGLLGTIVGTQKKPAQYDKALIKEFILRCIKDYRARPGYPGISFLFMWSYRKNVLQQIELEWARKQTEATKEDVDYDDLEEWL